VNSTSLYDLHFDAACDWTLNVARAALTDLDYEFSEQQFPMALAAELKNLGSNKPYCSLVVMLLGSLIINNHLKKQEEFDRTAKLFEECFSQAQFEEADRRLLDRAAKFVLWSRKTGGQIPSPAKIKVAARDAQVSQGLREIAETMERARLLRRKQF
jgi:hypothetical protein